MREEELHTILPHVTATAAMMSSPCAQTTKFTRHARQHLHLPGTRGGQLSPGTPASASAQCSTARRASALPPWKYRIIWGQYVLTQPSLPMSRCCAKFIWQGQPPVVQTRATSACRSALEQNFGSIQLLWNEAPRLQALDTQPLVVREGRGRGRGAAGSGEFIVAMLQNDNAAQAKPQAVAAGAQSGAGGHVGRRNSYSGCRAHMSSVS